MIKEIVWIFINILFLISSDIRRKREKTWLTKGLYFAWLGLLVIKTNYIMEILKYQPTTRCVISILIPTFIAVILHIILLRFTKGVDS